MLRLRRLRALRLPSVLVYSESAGGLNGIVQRTLRRYTGTGITIMESRKRERRAERPLAFRARFPRCRLCTLSPIITVSATGVLNLFEPPVVADPTREKRSRSREFNVLRARVFVSTRSVASVFRGRYQERERERGRDRVTHPIGLHDISLKCLLFASPPPLLFLSPPWLMHQHGADKHTQCRIRFFSRSFLFLFLRPGRNMLLLSPPRVAREVEKQACLPTDGQKEIFIRSPCESPARRGDVRAYSRRASSSAHA